LAELGKSTTSRNIKQDKCTGLLDTDITLPSCYLKTYEKYTNINCFSLAPNPFRVTVSEHAFWIQVRFPPGLLINYNIQGYKINKLDQEVKHMISV
jgi:hypothetical protein